MKPTRKPTPVKVTGAEFSLTPEQRNAIFAGDYTALKFAEGAPKPEVEAGQIIVLAMSKGGKQFLAKSHKERLKLVEEGKELLAEIPSEPTVWIILKPPKLKDGRWQVEFEARDVRETTRTLAGAPSGNREPGLKTRLRKRVPKRSEVKAPKFTPDAERGYGGGLKSSVDEREGVDDATLDRYSRLIEEENQLRRNHNHGKAEKLHAERVLADERSKGKPGKLRQMAIERQKRRLGEAA